MQGLAWASSAIFSAGKNFNFRVKAIDQVNAVSDLSHTFQNFFHN
jgi:hypothetical protein